jgi:hypothetical protein
MQAIPCETVDIVVTNARYLLIASRFGVPQCAYDRQELCLSRP